MALKVILGFRYCKLIPREKDVYFGSDVKNSIARGGTQVLSFARMPVPTRDTTTYMISEQSMTPLDRIAQSSLVWKIRSRLHTLPHTSHDSSEVDTEYDSHVSLWLSRAYGHLNAIETTKT